MHRAIRQLQGQPRIWELRSAPSRLSPVGGTGAIIDGTGKPASSLNISRPKLRS